MNRPSKHQTFMEIAHVFALRSTCRRRAVGCVLVDSNDHLIGSGYNGAPAGAPHCLDTPCSGALRSHGTSLGECDAIHAEQNALLQCRNVNEIAAIYTTSFPCIHCFKMIANTSACTIYFRQDYIGHYNAVVALNKKLVAPLEIVQLATGLLHYSSRVEAATGFRTT